MKRFIVTIVLLLLSTPAFSAEAVNTNTAQPVVNTAQPARIAVINLQKIEEQSTAALEVKGRAKTERDKYQALISKEEEQLRKEEAKLQEQRSILTAENFAEKSRQFKDKVAKVQRDFQEKRAGHEATIKKSFDQINKVVFEIISDLAREEGFDMAIPSSQIFFYDKKLDITDRVLERLNAKLPKLEQTSSTDTKEKPKNDKGTKAADKGKTTKKKEQ